MSSTGYAYVDHGELNRSIQETIKELRRVTGRYLSGEAVRKVHEENAEIFQMEMVHLAPMSKKAHYIKYAGNKNRKKLQPGNLKRSITVFPARDKDSTVVYIGPRRKGAKHGDRRADGFYGYFNAYGTVKGIKGTDFIMKAYQNKRGIVVQKILNDLKKQTELANRDMNKFVASV